MRRRSDPRSERRSLPSAPLLSLLVPVIGAGAVLAMNPSPVLVVFALLAPLMSLAALADAGWQGRRRSRARRAEVARAARRKASARRADSRRHRGELERLAPAAIDIMQGSVARAPQRLEVVRLRLGLERRTDGAPGAPVLSEGELALGIVGPPAAVRAVARGYLIQILDATAARPGIAGPDAELWPEQDAGPGSPTLRIVHAPAEAHPPVVALADALEELPEDLAAVIVVDGLGGGRVLRAEQPPVAVAVEAISAAAAARWRAGRRLRADPTALPVSIERGELGPAPGAAIPVGVAIREGDRETVALDLVADGPHAIVAGMTGSGKTEFLSVWVAGLVERYRPDEMAVLFVDFKGGTGFAAFTGHPHCVGLITDLDAVAAERALESLRAEIRRRERALREAGARDVRQCPGLGRLVVVIDEYAALIADFPLLGPLFADVAARGRALGMHLIIGTQRPLGVVRDALLANCSIRISFRVADAADSLALLGTAGAEALPSETPGRALLRVGSGAARVVQMARHDGEVRARDGARVPRPWLPPLPRSLSIAELPAGEGLVLGLTDVPAEQRYGVLAHRPESGALLVLGGAGSGRSRAMDLVGQRTDRPVVRDTEALWDALGDADGALIVDDVDLLIAGMSLPWQQLALDALLRQVRQGPSRGQVVALSAARMAGALHAVATLCAAPVQLRGADGVDEGPPGAGRWRGSAVQLALPDAPVRARRAHVERATGVSAIVGTATAADVWRTGPSASVPVATAGAWMSAWTDFEHYRESGRVLVLASAAELRTLTGIDAPPLLDGPDRGWLLDGGRILRVALDPDGSDDRADPTDGTASAEDGQ